MAGRKSIGQQFNEILPPEIVNGKSGFTDGVAGYQLKTVYRKLSLPEYKN